MDAKREGQTEEQSQEHAAETREAAAQHASELESARPVRVRLPGFVLKQDIGAGDLIKKTAETVGITPCSGCGRRAEWLNRRVTFTGRR